MENEIIEDILVDENNPLEEVEIQEQGVEE